MAWTSRTSNEYRVTGVTHMVPTFSLGQAAVRRTGSHVTLASVGAMMRPTLRAAKALAADGTDAEVIDCRTLVPLDTNTIKTSVGEDEDADVGEAVCVVETGA